jgi:hypothetical protein
VLAHAHQELSRCVPFSGNHASRVGCPFGDSSRKGSFGTERAKLRSLSRRHLGISAPSCATDLRSVRRAPGLSRLSGNIAVTVWRAPMVVPVSAVPAPRPKAFSATAGQSFRLPALSQPQLRHAEPKPEGQVHGRTARIAPKDADTSSTTYVSVCQGTRRVEKQTRPVGVGCSALLPNSASSVSPRIGAKLRVPVLRDCRHRSGFPTPCACKPPVLRSSL